MEVPAVIPYTLVKSMQAITNVYEMRLLTMILAKAQAGTRTYDARLKDFNIENTRTTCSCHSRPGIC